MNNRNFDLFFKNRVQIAFQVTGDMLANVLAKFGVKGINCQTAGGAAMHFLCEDAESYVACLKKLYDTSVEWCNPGSTPREHKKNNKDGRYWAADISRSLHAQKILAQMNRAEFQLYEVHTP